MLVVAFVSLACAMFGSAPVVVSPTSPPTAVAVVATTQPSATATEPERVEPTATVALPTHPPEPTATDAPTDTPPPPQPTEFEETFDRRNDNWSEDVVLTTQTFGRDLQSRGLVQDGKLQFRLGDKETYLYRFFVPALKGNVSVEAKYQSIGALNNGISIVCRVNEERTSWFEVRVASTSDFAFYRYEKRLREEENKNPYVMLGKGKFKIDELYPTKENTFKLTCLEDELILETNRGKRVVNQLLDNPLEGSTVGIGVMSYDVLPVTIVFDTITIREEQP
jgi:hypothetical protein